MHLQAVRFRLAGAKIFENERLKKQQKFQSEKIVVLGEFQSNVVFFQGVADVVQAKAMVDGVGFAGGENSGAAGWGGVGDFAVKGFCFFHKKKVDVFFCLLGQAVAGFDGVVKGIAKDDAKVARVNGQCSLNAYFGGEGDVLAVGQRLFGAEDGIQGVVAGLDGRCGGLKFFGQLSEIVLAAWDVFGIQIAF